MALQLRLRSLKPSACRRTDHCAVRTDSSRLAGRRAAADDFEALVPARSEAVYSHANCLESKKQDAKRQRQPNAFILVASIMCLSIWSFPSVAGQGKLEVTDAWVPAVEEVGSDVPLLMTIKNELAEPDALLRARCSVANFYERHTVDRGEGAPAMRPVSSIPIPARSTVVLKASEYHIMLLQIRRPLEAGDRFNCSLAFQKAGNLETEVEVRKSR